MLEQTKHSIAAIIVTYYPDDRLSDLLFSIGKQVDDIWVIDNGSTGQSKKIIEKLLKGSNTSFNLILNKENLGLATAQNQGIKEAMNLGVNWILLLDQDSIPAHDMTKELMFAADSYNKKEYIGMLTPRHENDDGKLSIPSYSVKSKFLLRRYFMDLNEVDDMLAFGMASGSLIPSHVLKEVGMMKEDFWIDYIDYDFSFRLRELGYRIIGVGAARLKHRLGDTSRINFGKKYLSYHVHPAFRRYTIYRNRVLVLRQHGLKFPSFLIFEILSIGKDFLKLIFIEDKKLSKFNAIIRGLIDGLLGKGGFKKF